MMEELVRRFPERPAITVDDRRITYAELDGIAASLAAGLAAEGIGPGDRVALFLGNLWEFLALILAINRLGAIAVPIGTRQRRAELAFVLQDCGAKALGRGSPRRRASSPSAARCWARSPLPSLWARPTRRLRRLRSAKRTPPSSSIPPAPPGGPRERSSLISASSIPRSPSRAAMA
jgi:non-ribosomal peptide synthetase component F